MRKPILAISATLSLMFGAMPAANAFTLSVVPQQTTVTLGEVAWVDVFASDLVDGGSPSIGAFDVDVTFDTSALSAIDVVYGVGLDLFGNGNLRDHTFGPGLVNVLEVSFDTTESLNTVQPGAFLLFSIAFDTLSAGTNLLALTANSISSAEGNSLVPDTLNGGSLSVVSPVPLPGAIWLLLSGLAGSGLLARFRAALRPEH